MRATLLALLLLTGCSKSKSAAPDPGPGCPEVVENMLVVMKQIVTGHGDVELGNRQQMIDQCEARKYSATERKCMVAAKTLDDLASCKPPATGSGKP